MTEFTPLAEAAGASVLLLFIGLPTAWRSQGFTQALRRQLGICVHVALWIVGRILGPVVLVAKWMVAFAWMLASLWWPNMATNVLTGWHDGLKGYCRSEFHQPQHAA